MSMKKAPIVPGANLTVEKTKVQLEDTEDSPTSSFNTEAERTSLNHDEGRLSTTDDQNHQLDLESSGRSDGIESILTQKTPQVPTDQTNMTPEVTLTQITSAVSSEPSTPEIKCIGRRSRGNSVNLMLELEEAASVEGNCEENRTANNDHVFPGDESGNISAGAVYLNNLFELHGLHQTSNVKECCLYTAELENTVLKQREAIETLLYEKKEQEAKMDNYSKQVFQKEQKIKILSDRAKQLENSHSYRKEVERLAGIVEQGEVELKMLQEDLKRSNEGNTQALEEKQKVRNELEASLEKEFNMSKELEVSSKKIKEMKEELKSIQEKMAILEENKSFLLNENVILKNEAKVHKRRSNEICHSPGMKADEGLEISNNAAMSKELKNLKKELQTFKQFTFKKLDELTGRGDSSSSSLSSLSGDDRELAGEFDEAREQQQPPQNKKKASPVVGLRYEGNTPTTSPLSPDELGRTIPLVPGPQTYSEKVRSSTNSPESSDYSKEEKARKIEGIRSRREARESKTLIFSSSITRDITRQQRSFNEKCVKSDVTIHQFKGKRASDIVKYMLPHLDEEQPSSVVFVAGGNDLPNRDISTEEIKKVASSLVEGGSLCRDVHGVKQVYISSIMPRANSVFQGNRHRLNNILRDMCKESNFTFIDNSNIVLSTHGHHDGVHLNFEGSELLRENLLNVLNS